MIRSIMFVSLIAIGGIVEAGHGRYHHGPYGPRFGVFIAPPPPPVVVVPPVPLAPAPVYPVYGYPAYPPPMYAAPVYPPPVYAPAGLGLQTRNFSLFLGR